MAMKSNIRDAGIQTLALALCKAQPWERVNKYRIILVFIPYIVHICSLLSGVSLFGVYARGPMDPSRDYVLGPRTASYRPDSNTLVWPFV